MKPVLSYDALRPVRSVVCLTAILLAGCSTSPSSGTTGTSNSASDSKRAADTPDLPIEVTFRTAKNGAGFAAAYTNNSKEFLEIELSLDNPTDKSNDRTILFNIGPGQTVVREQEEGIGFAYKSGDIITMKNAKYAPKKIVVK